MEEIINELNEKEVTNFLDANPNFKNFSDLIKWAVDKWIDPNFAIMVFWDKLKYITDPIIRKSEIEDMLAEFDRVRWIVWCSDKKGDDKLYDKDLALSLIIKFNPNNWKNISKIYWLKEDYINSYDDYSENSTVSSEYRVNKIKSLKVEKNWDFMKNAKTIAIEIEKVYWIPWKVTVWQSALESNWGKSWLSSKYNNYFWIKSFWRWKSINLNTQEETWWAKITIKDGFKVFDDMKDSFLWYAKFLTQNKRYRNAFKYWAKLENPPEYYPNDYAWYNPDKFIKEVAKAWYATASNYSQMVVQAWNKFDKIA